MKISFQKSSVSCLTPVLSQIQNMEQIQEVRLPEGMPEPEKILGCRGQCILRSKEWQGSSISLSAGLTVWVLYLAEGSSELQCLQSWIPFQFRWDVPGNCGEGSFRVLCLPGSMDARLVSPGKLSIRAGICAMAEVWCKTVQEIRRCPDLPGEIQLLHRDYPLRLPVETGEKQFSVEEVLTLPVSAPEMSRLVYARLDPQIGESRVLGDRLVFRGCGNLHVLYASSDGMLHSWLFELPFSQYVQLKEGYGKEAQASLIPGVTGLEAELESDGIHLKGELTAQYLVDDRQLIRLPEDAYIPGQPMEIQWEPVTLPALLDSRRENVYGEAVIPAGGDVVAESVLMPDFPRRSDRETGITLEIPANLQLMYYDPQGMLCADTQRWKTEMEYAMDPGGQLMALPGGGIQCRVMSGSGNMTAQITLPMELTAVSGTEMTMIAGLEPAEAGQPDPGRPSLILRRAEEGLWNLAKQSGSTMDAIKRANGLESEPAPGQLLLIPVL